MIYYVMTLIMLTIQILSFISTRFSQNALQAYKSSNKIISYNSVEKNNRSWSIITQNFNKNESKIELFDDPEKGKKLF